MNEALAFAQERWPSFMNLDCLEWLGASSRVRGALG
jgi:hypothetical protein